MKTIAIITPTKNNEKLKSFMESAPKLENITFEFLALRKGIEGVATFFDRTLIAPEILALAYQAEKQGADAVIINCLSEPALKAAKELLSIPVIGIFEAILQPLKTNNKPFLIVTPRFHPNYLQILEETIHLTGIPKTLISYAEINLDEPKEKQIIALDEAIKAACVKQHVDAIVLSSTYLAQFHNQGQSIIEDLKDEAVILIPLLETIQYVEKILTGAVIYNKDNLLPPKANKIQEWLNDQQV